MVNLMQIFNRHVREDAQVTSYEHPGCHMINGEIMRAFAEDVVSEVKANNLDVSDLHVRIDYSKPTSSQGNRKLHGIIYMANHPLFDCYLDGLNRQKPSCSGLGSWCYVFSDFFYKSYGKQINMMANSLLMYLDPDRARQEIDDWIEANKKKFVPDKNGHIAFRTDEAGDVTYSLTSIWLPLADKHPEIMFYAYTKQFDVINSVPYKIDEVHPNFRVLLSDSVKDDPNPLTKVREDYGSFAIEFKNEDKTPERVLELLHSPDANKHRCPGASFGCFKCTKCSEPESTSVKYIVAEEH